MDLESEAELHRLAERRRRASGDDAERSGDALLDMAIEDQLPGVGGRLLLTFVKRNRTLSMPWTRLKVGSPVVISAEGDELADSVSGVVSAKNSRCLQVAVNDYPMGDRFRIDMSADEVTRKRHRRAIMDVVQAGGRLAKLRDVLMGQTEPAFNGRVVTSPVIRDGLNASQQEAVKFALAADDLAIIHGPPGTGKTTTVVELVRQLAEADQSVLACAPSNTGVDNLLQGLVAAGVKCVRLGHPARVMSDLQDLTLDSLVANHDNMQWVKSLLREAEDLFRQAGRYTRARPARNAKRGLRDDAKQLKQQARELEKQAVADVLNSASVICTTTTIDEELLGDRYFDWAVIDEACQSTEPGCWVPLRRAERVVMAGDHCQLPPTILSSAAIQEGFGVSLMERSIGVHPGAAKMLEVQYRMHEQIMRFSSQEFYDDRLSAHESVVGHTLAQLANVKPNPLLPGWLDEPLLFIDTAGADYDEELEPDGLSKRNPQEAALVLKKVEQLADCGIPLDSIAVIAPYAAQVRLIRAQRPSSELEVDTVDGFQGREKEAVVITLVRSNRTGEIGFLADERRMNVALTRARRKLIVIGDSSTLGRHEFYARLMNYFESCQAYHSVWEEKATL